MSLLTLVQLQIVIAAMPALAGWVLCLPPAQPLLASAAAAARSDIAAPAVVQSRRTTPARQASFRQAAFRRLVTPVPLSAITAGDGIAEPPAVALRSFSPFPHAARAP